MAGVALGKEFRGGVGACGWVRRSRAQRNRSRRPCGSLWGHGFQNGAGGIRGYKVVRRARPDTGRRERLPHISRTLTDVAERLRAALAGRYDIARLLGAGGMATVYLA